MPIDYMNIIFPPLEKYKVRFDYAQSLTSNSDYQFFSKVYY